MRDQIIEKYSKASVLFSKVIIMLQDDREINKSTRFRRFLYAFLSKKMAFRLCNVKLALAKGFLMSLF
jgi:hypothetical protein